MLIKLQQSQKLHHSIIQKQIKKKYSWEKYISPELRRKFTDDLELKIVMEYQKKKKNLLDDTTNQPSKFRTRIGAEIHDEK